MAKKEEKTKLAPNEGSVPESKVLREHPTFTTPLRRKYIWFWRKPIYVEGPNKTTVTKAAALIFEIHGSAEFDPKTEFQKLVAAGLTKGHDPKETNFETLINDLEEQTQKRPPMIIHWGDRVRPVAQVELEKELIAVHEDAEILRDRNSELETVTANQASEIEALRAKLAQAGIKT